nr:MAG TPA: NlpE N-terminal domain [Bacteriophage sp.]
MCGYILSSTFLNFFSVLVFAVVPCVDCMLLHVATFCQ